MYQFINSIGKPRRLYQKIWLIMRLTTVILIACLMQVSAAGLAQKITLNERNAALSEVLKQISKQSGFAIYSDGKELPKNQKVTVIVKEASVEEALNLTLKGLGLTFNIEGNTIALKKKQENSFLENLVARFQEIDVTGIVLDENGNPMPGVTIKVKDQAKIYITDSKGMIKLARVKEGATILVSYVGYQTKELIAKEDLGAIQLELADSKLDEIQVIAYGKTSQRYSTGNVTTITSKEIEKSPVSNVLLAIQGRVPGLDINQSTGYAGSGVSFSIQGRNSINAGNDPLIVINGVPYPSQTASIFGIYGTSNIGQSSRGSTLNFINPSDIESITVLKDADATAIYGSKAANGAILITTKRGSSGRAKITINAESGISGIASRMKLMNTEQYLQMRREAIANDGGEVEDTDYDINGFWDNSRNTDWQNELLNKTANYSNFTGSISGGSNLVQYSFGGTFRKETTILPGKFRDIKGSTNFSLSTNSENNKFHLQFSGNYLIDNNQLPNWDITQFAMLLPPNAPALYNSDGSLNFMPNSAGLSTFINPLINLNTRHTANTHNLVSNLLLKYNILTGLNISTSLGYTYMQANELIESPITANLPELRVSSDRSAGFGNSYISNWIIEPQVTYNKTLGSGKLDIILGSSFQGNQLKGNTINASGYNTDESLPDIGSAALLTNGGVVGSKYNYLGFFSRISYTIADKYLLNVSARRDGTSRFGPANSFHNFAALGGGWVFSQEPAISAFLPFLSFGKLRASYGTTGNDQIGDYSYLNLYRTIPAEVKYRGIVGIESTGLFNPDLQWELTKKANFGLDVGVINDRILLNANYFINTSSNQLLTYELPTITGVSGIKTNFPAVVRNSGWEITIDGDILKESNFRWKASVNFTLPKNKLISFKNLETSTFKDQLIVGKPLTTMRYFKFGGVNSETGSYQFYDVNGNLTSSPDFQLDRTEFLNTAPKMYGGWTNSFSYRRFSLDVLLQFMKRDGKNDFAGFAFPGVKGVNQPAFLIGRWNSTNHNNADYQRYNVNYSLAGQWINAGIFSDRAFGDATYCRVKNVTLSWQLPENYLKAIGLSTSRIYVGGQNLFTITGYDGLDPETLSSISLPPLRTIVFGLQLGF